MSTGGGAFGRPPPSHHPPIRDASTLKYVLYGPGHEKFPSWPMAAAAEVPVAVRAPPTGGSQRSKSWTDHTNYPKEQVIAYTRPYMKRNNSSYPQHQQLKTVLERCEKKNLEQMQYIRTMDRRKSTNSNDYNNPSPPERDILKKMTYKSYSKESITPLTQADLEEYTKKLDETTHIQHQKQSSYAQSEGYHSYVSSSDSSSTPFIDSLRRDIDVSMTPMSRISSWDGESIVTTRSGSVSSSETLKWHGSLSDISDVSNTSGTSPRQLIVHSARVQTPQKQNSESVLYMPRPSKPDRLIAQRVNLAHTLPMRFMQQNANAVYPSPIPPRKTVAECINIYEGKNIKAIQKKALLSFYERHQDQMKKESKASETQPSYPNNTMRQNSTEYPSIKRMNPQMANAKHQIMTCDSPNSIFQGPVIMGPSISLDEWVPERPPKNRQLMMSVSTESINQSRRIPSPELPLPSPPPPVEEDFKCDDPLPPVPEKTNDIIRTSVDGYIHNNNYDRSSNPHVRDISIQPYAKPITSLSRKFINPYIKSTNMKYDIQHKIDRVPSVLTKKHTSLQIECETPVQYRNNKIPNNHHDPKLKLNNYEKVPYNQTNRSIENLNKSFEMIGRFRAEPVNLDVIRDRPVHDKNANPMVPSKIHRSNSETNQISYKHQINNFSKVVPQNQSIRKTSVPDVTISKPQQYGRQDSLNKKEVSGFPRFNKPIEKEITIKDDRPPLPDKKRSLPIIVQNHQEKDTPRPSESPNRILALHVECQKPVNEPQTEAVQALQLPKPEQAVLVDPVEIISKDPEKDIEQPKPVNHIIRLRPRKHLPEETLWESVRLTSPHLQSVNHNTKALLSEFNEYDNTAQHIVDAFADDIISLLADQTASDEDENTNSVSLSQMAEPQSLSTPKSKLKENDVNTDGITEKTVTNYKTEMENCLTGLIQALEKQTSELDEKMKINDDLGLSIGASLEKPHSTRFNRFMTDIGLITSLISSLMSRHNRITSNLNDLPNDHQNKNILESEKSRLIEKLEDAKALKKSIDNNRTKLLSMLQSDLNEDLMMNYKTFVCTKIQLVIYTRDVKDRLEISKRILSTLNQELIVSYQ